MFGLKKRKSVYLNVKARDAQFEIWLSASRIPDGTRRRIGYCKNRSKYFGSHYAENENQFFLVVKDDLKLGKTSYCWTNKRAGKNRWQRENRWRGENRWQREKWHNIKKNGYNKIGYCDDRIFGYPHPISFRAEAKAGSIFSQARLISGSEE